MVVKIQLSAIKHSIVIIINNQKKGERVKGGGRLYGAVYMACIHRSDKGKNNLPQLTVWSSENATN